MKLTRTCKIKMKDINEINNSNLEISKPQLFKITKSDTVKLSHRACVTMAGQNDYKRRNNRLIPLR